MPSIYRGREGQGKAVQRQERDWSGSGTIPGTLGATRNWKELL